jgi:hypothetical protein
MTCRNDDVGRVRGPRQPFENVASTRPSATGNALARKTRPATVAWHASTRACRLGKSARLGART